MAIIIKGKSKCTLCGQIIAAEDEIILFPAFIHNSKDPLYIFNDVGVHQTCLNRHFLRDEVLGYVQKAISQTRPENRVCEITNQIINAADQYIAIELLTSDKNEALFEFNFTTLHKDHLKQWIKRDVFKTAALKFKQEGKWSGNFGFDYLEYLIKLIE